MGWLGDCVSMCVRVGVPQLSAVGSGRLCLSRRKRVNWGSF